MKTKKGVVFSLAADNAPVPGCTVSEQLCSGETDIICFSLAKHTDISAEIYPRRKLIVCLYGDVEMYTADGRLVLSAGDAAIAPADIPVGMRSEADSVYIEADTRRSFDMNESIKAGEVFKLSELVPYRDGKIVNMDVVSNDKMKFVVMSFDAGTGLSEHAAPGEALIFALDGEGVIGYEGSEHPIKAGENFSFAKGGMHSVRADKKFKMALLLTLE